MELFDKMEKNGKQQREKKMAFLNIYVPSKPRSCFPYRTPMSLEILLYFFASKTTANNAVMLQKKHIELPDTWGICTPKEEELDQPNEYSQALWHHNIV